MTIKDFADGFRTIWGLGSLVTTVGPLALWLAADFEPPWPTGSAIVATIFCGLLLIIAYFRVAEGDVERRLQARRSAIGCIVVGLFLLFVYLGLSSQLVMEETRIVDSTEEHLRFVKGFVRLHDIDPTLSDREALRESLYRPEEVWKLWSLTASRLALLLSFCIAFGSMTYGLAIGGASKVKESESPQSSG